MIGYIKKIQDSNGNGIFPVTTTTSVYFPNTNQTLDEFLESVTGDYKDIWDKAIEDALTIAKQSAEIEVVNHSIYVRGAMGVPNSEITASWIRAQESAAGIGTETANKAVALWNARKNVYPNLKAFNCSGYTCYVLGKAGIVKGQKTVLELWNASIPLAEPVNGCICFRIKDGEPYHCGMYFDGMQYHSKNEENGVVRETYDGTYWHAYGLPKVRA